MKVRQINVSPYKTFPTLVSSNLQFNSTKEIIEKGNFSSSETGKGRLGSLVNHFKRTTSLNLVTHDKPRLTGCSRR